jgi:hypothetical protein
MTDTVKVGNEELKHRVLARKLELEARLEHIKADTAAKTAEVRIGIQKDLDDLGSRISEGWENLSEATVQGLNDWFKHTDSH